MDEKEFFTRSRSNEDFEGGGGGGSGAFEGIKAKLSNFSQQMFVFTKLVVGILLIPFVYASTVSFLAQLALPKPGITKVFFWGVNSFLVLYLFIWEAALVYKKGQKIVEAVFRFFTPLVKVAPYLLPIYTLILLLVSGICSLFDQQGASVPYFVFLFGFSVTLHLVFSSKQMRKRQGDKLKANYIFGFSFIYIINLAILALGLSLTFKEFSFVNFCNQSYQIAGGFFSAAFRQLFL